jgi:hypothetical protein
MWLSADDYTLAILPLARLPGGIGQTGQCCAGIGRDWNRYREVLETGLLGYRLYTYHRLVASSHGPETAQRVYERHLDMLGSGPALGGLLAIIDSAVGIGAVTTLTRHGGVTTPVELNVALALLLGIPESPHYVTRPELRSGQIARIMPELDGHFADCLVRAREEMTGVYDWLMAMPGIVNGSPTGPDKPAS